MQKRIKIIREPTTSSLQRETNHFLESIEGSLHEVSFDVIEDMEGDTYVLILTYTPKNEEL